MFADPGAGLELFGVCGVTLHPCYVGKLRHVEAIVGCAKAAGFGVPASPGFGFRSLAPRRVRGIAESLPKSSLGVGRARPWRGLA
jgi:hypothetical protein